MKIRLVVAAIGLLFGCFYSAIAQQSNERLITRLPVEKNEPLEIRDIKVNGQSVSFNKKFFAGDDWMLTLTFTVKNRSDRRILFANLDLFFSPPAASKPVALFDLLSYGKYALTSRSPSTSERSIGLSPGETVEIGFNAQSFVDVTRFLADLGFPQRVDRVKLGLGRVIFEDDTMWYAGAFAQRDPKDPASWINSRYLNSKPQ